MRYYELFEFAPNIPQKYMVDDETDLALNLPSQWTQSPYLGAVKSPKGEGYVSQIHIPQTVWTAMVDQTPSKWSNAPKSFFNATGNQRPSMRVSFADPRQAAWFSQEALYGGDWSAQDVIEDYFEELYCGGDGAVWRHVKSQVPSFEGAPLESKDEAEWMANHAERKKQITVQNNTSDYNAKMPEKIKAELLAFYSKNKQITRKRFGSNIKSLNDLKHAISDKVDEKGIDFFLTVPGGVKLKNIPSLSLD